MGNNINFNSHGLVIRQTMQNFTDFHCAFIIENYLKNIEIIIKTKLQTIQRKMFTQVAV